MEGYTRHRRRTNKLTSAPHGRSGIAVSVRLATMVPSWSLDTPFRVAEGTGCETRGRVSARTGEIEDAMTARS